MVTAENKDEAFVWAHITQISFHYNHNNVPSNKAYSFIAKGILR